MAHRTPLLAAMMLAALSSLSTFAGEVPLVGPRSVWKYLDDGSNQGTAWRAPAFDDSSWPSGPAELGYGDGDEATIVGFGPDPTRHAITTYFRQSFFAPDPSTLTALRLRVVRDDGAIVYVNGAEVWRLNMPEGEVGSTTAASTTISDADEDAWQETTLPASVLVSGTNTVAVEIHQAGASSSDISFALELAGDDGIVTPNLTRGPYLQMGASTSMVVRWRTDLASDSRVRYGTSPAALTQFADDTSTTTEHEVRLTGLTPYTRYYYSVGTTQSTIAGGTNEYTFLTAPSRGNAVPTRVWVLGDSGTAGSGARAVRNAFYGFSPAAPNLWLMLGDNAYSNGLDSEYQRAVFDMYPEVLRSSVLWPAIGNHDTANSSASSTSYPYYSIFTLPARGEAGGVASGTESYYSFDYGNIHFICLDSMTSNRSSTGPMLTWLRDDLASTSQPWIIAFWHHPPYTKGSHDSDWEQELIDMRENALPILEDAGVDLVLAGHSHSYERSYLIDGHYGYSDSFVSSMKIDGGDGRTAPYRKPTRVRGPHEGAVYATAGSSGTTSGGPLNHPAMVVSLNNLGSMVLEIDGDQLQGRFLREDGSTADSFTIVKGTAAAPPVLTATAVSTSQIDLAWTSADTSFRVERCSGASCTSFAEIAQTAAKSFSDTALATNTVYRYRVVAAGGTSNIAEAATTAAAPSALTATSVSSSQIDLTWTSMESSFRIERCTGPGCTAFAAIAQTSTTSYSDSGLSSSMLYRYRVIAPAGTSNIAEATTELAPPAALAARSVSASQIDLTWTSGASSFRIERCSGAGCTTFAAIAQTTTTAYSDSGLTGSTLYRYRVVAIEGTMTSAPSNVAEATTALAPPTSLVATAVSVSQIDLQWTSNASAFRIERCTGPSCTAFAAIAQTTTPSFSNTGLASGTVYRYRVFAISGSEVSAASNVAQATTLAPPAAPSSLTITGTTASSVSLAWNDNATNESGFRIERCSGSCTSFTEIAVTGANVRTFTSTGLTRNTSYKFRVRAYNAAGTSGYSNTAGTKTRPK